VNSYSAQEWDHLVTRNFLNPIKRYYDPWTPPGGKKAVGVDVVVLAFDDYKYVSNAKAITQANRSKHVPKFKLDDRQHLEPKVPHNYNERLRNRAYKRMVIDCIVASIPKMLNLKVSSVPVNALVCYKIIYVSQFIWWCHPVTFYHAFYNYNSFNIVREDGSIEKKERERERELVIMCVESFKPYHLYRRIVMCCLIEGGSLTR
jgi:hypothetical protein